MRGPMTGSAKQSRARRDKVLDCFVASFLAMTVEQAHSSSVIVRESGRSSIPERAVVADRPRRTGSPACAGDDDRESGSHLLKIRLRDLAADCTRVLRDFVTLEIRRAQGMPGEGLTHGPPAKEKLAAKTT